MNRWPLRWYWTAPVTLALGFFAWVLILSVPGVLLVMLFFGTPILVVGLALTVGLLGLKSWRAALLFVLTVPLLYGLAQWPRPYDSAAANTARWLQFAYYWPELNARAGEQAKHHPGPQLIVLAVDGFTATGSDGFVYDSTRQLRLTRGTQSADWRAAVEATELGSQCAWSAQHLFGPYFAFSSSC